MSVSYVCLEKPYFQFIRAKPRNKNSISQVNCLQQQNFGSKQSEERIKTREIRLKISYFRLNLQSEQLFVHAYNNIQLEHQLMNLNEEFDLYSNEEMHFYTGHVYGLQNEVEILMERPGFELDYMLQRPSFQIEELLKNFVLDCPINTKNTPKAQNGNIYSASLEKIKELQQKASTKKQKKIKKNENSPFHNYQKHLNNALKKLIIVPEFELHDGPEKLAAIEIWKAYCRCEIKTKRILHFIFNERNEHTINDSELRTYGLFGIYQRFGEEVVSQARTYLSKLAIDQIDRQNIDGYLKSRKLRSKEGFEEYILAFRTELENGYLKRRIHLEKI